MSLRKGALLAFVAVSIEYLGPSNTQPPETTLSDTEIKPPVNDFPNETAALAVPISEEKVVAQYFHGTTRCDTCGAIEALTREAFINYVQSETRSHNIMSTKNCRENDRKMTNIFERYLTVWVVLCIVSGIILGKIAPGMAVKLEGSGITGAEIGWLKQEADEIAAIMVASRKTARNSIGSSK